jgi:ribosomal protein S17E
MGNKIFCGKFKKTMNFDKLIEKYETQLEFDFNPKKEIPKEEAPKTAKKTPVEIAREDKTPREFTIIWDRNTYHTTAISKEQALGHIAARISKGSTKPVGVLRKEMDGCSVKDEKWNLKY